MSGGYAIQIQNVEKKFGEHVVLQNVNLDIKPGEFIAIVGKSGCGKSTLLRLITDLEESDSGSIRVMDGERETKKEGVKFLFQEARLLPWKKVWKNIALVSPDQSREAAVKALHAVGLEDKADAWPETLSGGQKQRVSLARALSSDPKVLLLDEPLGALDALTRIEMQILIEELWRENGLTVILVTHDVGEAVYLADRVVLIEEGGITMDERITLGRPRERDSDFAYFEDRILNRVLGRDSVPEKKIEFMI
ncbi:sulfonate transport system ATP-binding protein [Hespellia stercorisuis DSM 15480]|uniref:Sulfonate transport system ATP-binding protein n=2 Tax=Hespellia stercorisuis TaxID=180311 RepID=A0A1M6JWD5_9FIRM|nr:sulfonate transport system ATP-binding protein [Hespellia stercorisuis DSM 15480]